MIGTITTTGKPQQLLSAAYAARDSLRAIGWRGRQQMMLFNYGSKNYKHGKPIAETIPLADLE